MSLERIVNIGCRPCSVKTIARKNYASQLDQTIKDECIRDGSPIIYSKPELKKIFYRFEFTKILEVSTLNSTYANVVIIPLVVVKFLTDNPNKKFDINEIIYGVKEKEKIDLEAWKPQISYNLSPYSLKKDNDIIKLFNDSNIYMYSPECAEALRNKFPKRKGICFKKDCDAGICPRKRIK